MSTSVSFIIPCYNSHRTIADSITSIVNQNTDAMIEILIVDSSINFYTKDIVKNFNLSNVRYLHSKRRLFAGQARNLGISKMDGNYFALIDSDIILPENWTESMLDHYNKIKNKCNGKVILSGTIKNALKTKSYLKDSLLLMLSNKYLYSKKIQCRKYLPGCNLFFERNLKAQVVFPDVESGEDILMTKKIHNENVELTLIGPNVVEHQTLKSLYQYSFELGISSYMISIKGSTTEKFSLPIKLIFGFFYKLIKVHYNVLIFGSNSIIKLLIYFPGVVIGSLFFHLGILYGLFKRNNNIKR